MSVAAYCDVDGTLARTTIVTPLIWFKKKYQSAPGHWLWLASLAVRGPYWLVLDRISREASNRAIYSSYGGMAQERLNSDGAECYRACIKPRLFPAAREKVKSLQASGVKIVLVSGGLDILMHPLAEELGAELIAPSLAFVNGICTGSLTTPPLAGVHKATAVREHAAKHGVDLAQSYALGDAMGDLPMLECVGNPVAVNADGRLASVATERGWKCESWTI
jgi:HAD superfamily hydrolase (TIGR01490 family)